MSISINLIKRIIKKKERKILILLLCNKINTHGATHGLEAQVYPDKYTL